MAITNKTRPENEIIFFTLMYWEVVTGISFLDKENPYNMVKTALRRKILSA